MGLLRITLALTVVLAHSGSLFGLTFTGGVVAVEVFFIISGFYMSMILDKKYIGKGSYYLFISNRLLRLYPVYWTILFLTLLVSLITIICSGTLENSILSPYITFYNKFSLETLIFLILTNIFLLGQDVVMFLGINPENGNVFFTQNFWNTSPQFFRFLIVPQAWTLGIELMFYLIAPLLVKRKAQYIILLIFFSLGIRLYTYVVLKYSFDPWTYRFFPSELALFLLGTLSYKIYNWQQNHNLNNVYTNIIVSLFFCTLFLFQFIPFNHGYSSHAIRWSFYTLTCLSIPFIFKLTKNNKIDNRIGELSYPIYISHTFVISLISPLIERLDLKNYEGLIAIACTTSVSYLLTIIISDRIEILRLKRITSASHIN